MPPLQLYERRNTNDPGPPIPSVCHPCAREDPVSLFFANGGKSKDPGCPIEPGMTRRNNGKGPFLAPAGGAAPRSRPFHLGGEDCLSVASSAAHTTGTGAQEPPWGPRPGATGFGAFCRNKRTSSCGGETPQDNINDPGCPIEPDMTEGGVAAPSYGASSLSGAASDAAATMAEGPHAPG